VLRSRGSVAEISQPRRAKMAFRKRSFHERASKLWLGLSPATSHDSTRVIVRPRRLVPSPHNLILHMLGISMLLLPQERACCGKMTQMR
jgi:hypothetical protein